VSFKGKAYITYFHTQQAQVLNLVVC
jgi:hypothetical protein